MAHVAGPATDALAQFAAETVPAGLPDGTLRNARTALLDTVACVLVGSTAPWTQIVRADAEGAGSSGNCPVFEPTVTVAAPTAARINGTAAHAYELDDIYMRGLVHPGAVVVPAVLAVGAERTVTFGEALTAVVVGYEVVGRLANALGRRHNDKGFHTTSVLGPLGAAAACARLTGADREEARHALGIAASFGSGTKAFQQGGGMVKRLHTGMAAEGGVTAARLAAGGLTGPRAVIEGPRGLFDAFDAARTPESLTELTEAGQPPFVVDDVHGKQFPTCSVNHSAVAETLRLMRHHELRAQDVTRVVVGTSQRVLQQNSLTDLIDDLTAQYSTQYAVGLALRGEAQDPTCFTNGGYHETARIESMDKVSLQLDHTAEDLYPGSMSARVELHLADGSRVVGWAQDPPGQQDPGRRWSDVAAKATTLLARQFDEATAKRVVSLVENLSLDAPFARMTDTLRSFPDVPSHSAPSQASPAP